MAIPQHERKVRFFLVTLMVAVMYAVTGILGLMLATGSPYSTAIWIPSGIALGSVLVFGLEALPGIFLGSLIINYHVSTHAFLSLSNVEPFAIGCIVGLGAATQATFGWWLVRKWIGLNNTLLEPNDIIFFAVLTGPISCLVNATTSNFALYLLDVIPLANIFQSWSTWYIGDSMGVLIFTPVFLIIFAEPKIIWRSRILPVLAPLCVSFAIVIFGYGIAHNDVMLSSQLWFILVCGLFFCVLINMTLLIIHGQKNLAELELKETLRSAGEAILSVGMDEKIIYANPAAASMWRMPQEKLIGLSIHDLIFYSNINDEKSHVATCPIYAAIHQNQQSEVSNNLLTRSDHSEFWSDYTCSPLMISNKIKGAVIVINDITARREAEANVEHLVHYDMLTGLPNRYSFIETLKYSLTQPQDKELLLSVIFLDLDNFKNVNDTLGHAAGDKTLCKFAKRIENILDPMDYFARLGGDEFGIILHNKNQTAIEAFYKKLTEITHVPLSIDNTPINLTFSIGISTYPSAGSTADELIRNADIAMYKAKELGKNTFTYYTEELNKALTRLNLVESELRNAIGRYELALNYQPQIDINTSHITGVEVLLRWNNSTLGQVSPAEFIPIAERNGLIHPIGHWILKQVAKEYQDMVPFINQDFKIAINVSVVQLNDTRFYQTLVNLLGNTSLAIHLIIEITETAFITNPRRTIEIMRHINKLGVTFSLDDFGMNYSSMRYLKSLPISQLKIDYYFIKDIIQDTNDIAIVNTILQLAKGLNLPAIAEGVETRAQLDLLQALGCQYVQGFYYHKPMPMKFLLPILKDQYLTQ